MSKSKVPGILAIWERELWCNKMQWYKTNNNNKVGDVMRAKKER